MIKQIPLIALLTSMYLIAVTGHAQSDSPLSPAQSRPTVYVLNIDRGSGTLRDNIDDFAQQLLVLRIGQLKGYRVEKRERDKVLQCTTEGEVVSNGQEQVTIGSDASHYVVNAAIKLREPEKTASEAVLDYELLKCTKGGRRVPLAQSTYSFPYAEVLSHLNSMADTISFLLEQEMVVTKIAIDFKGVIGTDFGIKLGKRLLDRLKDAQEFEPRVSSSPMPQSTPAEYTVSGRVFAQGAKLWFEVEIRNRRGRSFKKVFDGPVQSELSDIKKQEDFYDEKSLLAVDYLTFVRNVADTDQPLPPSDIEADKSLRQSKELMCTTEATPAGCIPQASPAADLLSEVVRNKKFNTMEVWELLGGALLQANENSRAAEAFEKAAARAEIEGKSAAVPELLSLAGRSWLEARNLVAAGNVYDRLLKLSPSRLDAHLGRAKSYRYNNENLKALEFLLDSIALLPDAKELKEELGFLAGSLLPAEVAPTMKILEARKEKPSTAVALTFVRKRQVELILLEAVRQYQHAQYDSMDAELKKAEALADQVPEMSDEAISIIAIRGLWHGTGRHEFDEALRDFRDARRRIVERGSGYAFDIEELDVEIARNLHRRGLVRADKTEARKDFEEASSILTKIARMRGQPEALPLLRVVNHELGKDNDTRDLIQQRIDENPSIDDFFSLGFICDSYNADPECGLKVAAALKESKLWSAEANSNLLRTEALTLKGDNDGALAAQQAAVNSGLLSTKALAVAHFYGILLDVERTQKIEIDSLMKWRLIMRKLRDDEEDVEWVFDGASRQLETEQSIPAGAKAVLRDMVAAMKDAKKPLPELPPTQ